MENQHFLDEKELNVTNERPTFLTVLCIITFVVSGFMFLSSIYSGITYNKEEQIAANEATLEQLLQMASEDETGAMEGVIPAMETFNTENVDYATLMVTINIISALLSLLGAIFMYKMRKTGFHLYIGSKVIGLIPLLFFTLSMPVFLTYGFFIFFTAVFVFLYSRNLKYLS